jgi:hypothetical protein
LLQDTIALETCVGCGERGDDHICLSIGFHEFVDVFKVDFDELVVDEVRVGDINLVAGEEVKVFAGSDMILTLVILGRCANFPTRNDRFLPYSRFLNFPRKNKYC